MFVLGTGARYCARYWDIVAIKANKVPTSWNIYSGSGETDVKRQVSAMKN